MVHLLAIMIPSCVTGDQPIAACRVGFRLRGAFIEISA